MHINAHSKHLEKKLKPIFTSSKENQFQKVFMMFLHANYILKDIQRQNIQFCIKLVILGEIWITRVHCKYFNCLIKSLILNLCRQSFFFSNRYTFTYKTYVSYLYNNQPVDDTPKVINMPLLGLDHTGMASKICRRFVTKFRRHHCER